MMARVRKRSWLTETGEKKSAWAVDWSDHANTRHRKQFSIKRDADAFRVEIEGQLRTGLFRPEAAKITVAEAATEFYGHCHARMARGERMTRATLLYYKGHIDNYIIGARGPVGKLPPFEGGIGHLKLVHLTTRAVSDFRDRLRDAGRSVMLTRKVIGSLHCIMEFAKSQDYIAANPAAGIRVIGRRNEGAKRVVPPSKELVAALLRLAGATLRLRIVVAAAAGPRAGELHALRWRHVNFDSERLRIETRVDAWGNEDGQGTKTASGNREVPLAHMVVAQLREWRLRSRFSAEDDLIFPNARGKYTRHGNMVKRRFKPLLKQLAELHKSNPGEWPEPENFTWRGFRHFAISCWIEAGLSLKTVQTFAGHASSQITMDRYGHLFPSDDHSTAMNTIGRSIFMPQPEK